MKVILRSAVPQLGRPGDIKEVSAGFGRNYLLPRGLAAEATPAALKFWEKGKEKRAKVAAQESQAAKDLAGKLAGVTLSFSRQAAEDGKLFGSVGKSDLLKSLKSVGFTLEKGAVALESSIKTLGEHEVELKLAPEVSAKIKVQVSARQ
jgi:large subunit ribosomal protein L9